ncbi:MAG: YjjW family glycine radical enzyme activase [Enterobacteriaceae bacterium]
MSKICATVSKILPFSCVDGPGNRMAIFLQGCNYRCLNCHNPYTMGICNHCGDCVANCPHGALTLEQGRVQWHAELCQQCDTCLQTCTHSASPMTREWSVGELLAEVKRYQPFINGITFSGGEATLQLPFLLTFLRQLRLQPELQGLSCFIDSNGSLSATGWQSLLPLIDGAMIDLKGWRSEVHQQLTGRANQRVRDSIRLLAEAGKLYEVRLLLIPGQTDYQHYFDEMAQFLLSLPQRPQVRINAFHNHGVRGEAKQWPAAQQQEVESMAQALKALGVREVVTPEVYL